MLTADFDYDLPPELIAQEPIEPRDASRMLVLDRATGRVTHRHFSDIIDYLRPGDLLVANESRVIPARLPARKLPTGGRVELLLVARHDDTHWEALVKGRKVPVGQRLALGAEPTGAPEATVEAITAAGGRLLRFEAPIDGHLDRLGVVPLPPYIHTSLADAERYQTVYAAVRGSVAAPTAGLHFTPDLMARLGEMGVEWATVLLHIGLDTFRPVSEDVVEEHQIHTEYCEVSAEAAERINRAKAEGRRVIAVGTTSVRVLEDGDPGRGPGRTPVAGPYRAVHLSRLPLPGGGRVDHQFPPAAVVAADAGIGAGRPRDDAGRLRRGGAGALPLLQLWRQYVHPLGIRAAGVQFRSARSTRSELWSAS